jgi:hypothetical protein
MKPFLLLLAGLLAGHHLSAQYFEGEVIYQMTYKSKMKDVSDERITNAMGDESDYYVRGGDYKNVGNGTIFQWQLYRHDDNRLYNKMTKTNGILWIDGASDQDTVYSSSMVFGAATVLGYSCDELILYCRTGTQQYYFSSKLALDSRLYAKHRFANYYDYISRAHAVPLMYVIDTKQFTVTSKAVTVKPGPLDPGMFVVPAGALLSPMPQN